MASMIARHETMIREARRIKYHTRHSFTN